MDPNRALEDAREACRLHAMRGNDLDAFDDLVEAFEALDHWLSIGGFLPKEWEGPKVLPDVTPNKE